MKSLPSISLLLDDGCTMASGLEYSVSAGMLHDQELDRYTRTMSPLWKES